MGGESVLHPLILLLENCEPRNPGVMASAGLVTLFLSLSVNPTENTPITTKITEYAVVLHNVSFSFPLLLEKTLQLRFGCAKCM